jgi:trk system potassium uptake protein TrkH
MQFNTVFHYLGWALGATAILMLAPAAAALAEQRPDVAQAFVLSAMTTAFVGVALVLALKRSQIKSGPREGVLFVILFWFAISLFAALPLAATKGFHTYLEAWFESVSGLTTTGASLIEDFDAFPKAIFLWRALLQWFGGIFTVMAAAHVLTRWSGHELPVRRQRLPSFVHGDDISGIFAKIGHSLPAIFIVYCCVTLFAFAGYWIGGIPGWEALCLSLSSVASGGFSTRAGSMSAFGAPFAEGVMVLVMIFGSISVYVHWQGLRGNWREYIIDRETRNFALALVVTWIVYSLIDAQLSDTHSLATSLFNSTALLTTSGYFVLEGEGLAIPAFAMLLPVLIGGAAISATGGLKIVRMGMLLSHSHNEVRRLSFPHGSFKFRYNRQQVSEHMMANVWALFLAYMSVIAITCLVIAGAGFDFTTSFAGAIAMAMNAGPLLEASAGTAAAYSDFPGYVHVTLIFTMIAGRVEILAFLAVLSLRFWRA